MSRCSGRVVYSGGVRAGFLKTALWMSAAVLLGIAPRSGMPADLVPASLRITAPSADGTTIAGIYSFAVDSSSFPNIATVEFDIASLRLGVVQSAPYEVSWNTGYGK